MSKTLLLDCRFWGPSHTGLGRYTESLTRALHNEPLIGIKVHCLINKAAHESISKALPRFETAVVNSRPYSLQEQREIPKVVLNLKPDLTHYFHFNVPLAAPTPFMVTIHDLIKHHSKGLNTTTRTLFTYPIKRIGYHLTVARAVKRARHIITPSDWVKQDLLAHYRIGADKMTAIAEAAAPVYFKTKASDRSLAPSYPYIIYVGNAYPHKNVLQLIKAVKKYNTDFNKQLHLVIVTAKDFFYQQLRLKIRELKAQDVVRIQGFSTDRELRALYTHSVAFMTASLFEGFGLPGLEAMAAGTLTLSAKRTSLPEVYGQAAFYFDPQNLDSMVKIIAMAANLSPSDRHKRIKAGREHAATFSWEQNAKQTIALYETGLGLRSSQ